MMARRLLFCLLTNPFYLLVERSTLISRAERRLRPFIRCESIAVRDLLPEATDTLKENVRWWKSALPLDNGAANSVHNGAPEATDHSTRSNDLVSPQSVRSLALDSTGVQLAATSLWFDR